MTEGLAQATCYKKIKIQEERPDPVLSLFFSFMRKTYDLPNAIKFQDRIMVPM